MKHYELTYLISPDLSEKDVFDFQEKIISLIQETGGALGEVKELMRKKMAYLATLNFHLDPEKLGSLEKRMKSESQVLRYMILTKKVPKKRAPVTTGGKRTGWSPEIATKPKKIVKPEAKVELKEIEKKLEEILGEQ
jgi:ribosomal protein S6